MGWSGKLCAFGYRGRVVILWAMSETGDVFPALGDTNVGTLQCRDNSSHTELYQPPVHQLPVFYQYMSRVDREFVHNFQFFVEKRERIVNGKIRARNTSSEEKALHDDDWNEPDPHGCRNRHEPHPQGAADGVRHKRGAQGAREKPAFLEEVTDDWDCPKKREVPHLASYRMCDEGNNGKRGHDDVKRHFSREVECGHGERQEPDKRRRVGEIHSLCHKMESLHEKNSND